MKPRIKRISGFGWVVLTLADPWSDPVLYRSDTWRGAVRIALEWCRTKGRR